MTASAWVVNKDRSKILLAYHNIYDSWAWLGGHADGEKDLLKVALKEVAEESGVKNIKPVSEDILSVEILTVDGHEKKGVYVPSHLHLTMSHISLRRTTPSSPTFAWAKIQMWRGLTKTRLLKCQTKSGSKREYIQS